MNSASNYYLSDKEEATAKATAALDAWMKGVREAISKKASLPIDGFLLLHAAYADALAMDEEFQCVSCKEPFNPKTTAHRIINTTDERVQRIVICEKCNEEFEAFRAAKSKP